jgi:hypothetical protein
MEKIKLINVLHFMKEINEAVVNFGISQGTADDAIDKMICTTLSQLQITTRE